MNIKRLFRRRHKQGQIDADEIDHIARGIYAGADEETTRALDLFALRVALGVGPDDPRSYEELVAEFERRGK